MVTQAFLSYTRIRLESQTTLSGVVPLFTPHPGLDDRINRAIVQSEIEGGVWLRDLPEGTELEIQTENHNYTLIYRGAQEALLSGHPKFCPEPTPVIIHGCTWGGSMIKRAFLGRSMHLEFSHPHYNVIHTSKIMDIRERPAGKLSHRPASRVVS